MGRAVLRCLCSEMNVVRHDNGTMLAAALEGKASSRLVAMAAISDFKTSRALTINFGVSFIRFALFAIKAEDLEGDHFAKGAY